VVGWTSIGELARQGLSQVVFMSQVCSIGSVQTDGFGLKGGHLSSGGSLRAFHGADAGCQALTWDSAWWMQVDTELKQVE